MTVTRHPTGQDLICLVCGTDQDIDIDHIQAKGMGGSKERDVPENKSPLCRGHHDAKHNRVLETRVREARSPDRPWEMFFEWRRGDKSAPWISVPVEISQRYGCLVKKEDSPVLSAAAEAATSGSTSKSAEGVKVTADPTPPRGLEGDITPESVATHPSAAAPSAGSKEESDGQQRGLGSIRGPSHISDSGGVPDSGGDESRRTVSPLTHEQRVAIAQEIKDAQLQRQWRAGDVANAWDEELNEDFWNIYANEFGYTYPSLRNIMRVCRKIPRERRHPEASFAHHNVMVGFDIETRDAWLDRAHDEEWPVKRLREELVEAELLTKKPKVKRWTLDDLWKLFEEWHEKEECEDCHAVDDFFRWLGGQG
jgi:hypothetical protein